MSDPKVIEIVDRIPDGSSMAGDRTTVIVRCDDGKFYGSSVVGPIERPMMTRGLGEMKKGQDGAWSRASAP